MISISRKRSRYRQIYRNGRKNHVVILGVNIHHNLLGRIRYL